MDIFPASLVGIDQTGTYMTRQRVPATQAVETCHFLLAAQQHSVFLPELET